MDPLQRRRGMDCWNKLPESLVEQIVSYMTYSERCRFLAMSKSLWDAKGVMDRRMRQFELHPSDGRRFILSQPFQSSTRLHGIFQGMNASVQCLTLDECVDDGFIMVALVQLGLFPNLESLRMRSCEGISDVGLEALSRSAAAASNLRSIDITFCSNTSYMGTFCLRDQLLNLEVIRRQPEWLDGQFETPFARAGDEVEVHVYYADGSFSFHREFQSHGFVCQLYRWDHDFLGDKLQYNNFVVPEGWPSWTPFCYRPGVCLLRLDECMDESPMTTSKNNDTELRTVLVGQYFRGLRPPRNRILMEHAKENVPVGESRYFDTNTFEMIPEAGPESILISRMRLRPLTQLMPPPHLVQACRETCVKRENWDPEFLKDREASLEEMLSVNLQEPRVDW